MMPRSASLIPLKRLRPSRGLDGPLRRSLCAQCLRETRALYHNNTHGLSRPALRLSSFREATSNQVLRKPSVGLPAVWVAGQRKSLATVRHSMQFLATGVVLG